LDESELLRRSRRGDRDAFGQLVARYQAPVYRVVRGILADEAECEDVAQEAFLRAYENIGRFRAESGFFTWLYRIAVNEALRVRRKKASVTAGELPEAEAPRAPEEDGPTLATLQRLLGRLPDDYRAILVLRDLEGLSYQDISSTLDIPLGTVESRIFRARQELRAMWRRMKETQAR